MESHVCVRKLSVICASCVDRTDNWLFLQDELEPIQNIEDTHQLLVDNNNGWIPCSEKLPEPYEEEQ